MNPRVVLASSSPRRAALLRQLGLEFDVRVPPLEETAAPGESPSAMAERLACEKVVSVAHANDEIVIAADTVVVAAGELLEKPVDAEDALRMLMLMSGGSHTVITGLAVARDGRIESGTDRTTVWFRSLAASECQKYVATGEPLDKAGAYGIQGYGAALVRRVEGDFYNVMGLPVHLLFDLLRRLEIQYVFGRLEST